MMLIGRNLKWRRTNSYRIVGDPTEGCHRWWQLPKPERHLKISQQAFPREHEIPFDSARKRMVTVHSIEATDLMTSSPILTMKHAGHGMRSP